MKARATHIVQKRFKGPDGFLEAGVEVDASAWRNTKQMVKYRYLVPLDPTRLIADTVARLREKWRA